MKLKKLEINGFKSFSHKSAIDFPSGISAVVGPNGCGKSNIFDALRWVMGEQSVKTLRGKSMEDVIFSGTNGNPALNMAEVNLTLLNDNGSVPEEFKDYSEIMVTRRLYRSGESGFFINKRPCRLKDIHNLFLGSGMGTKSYAVIQQGNIGAITDAGPDEKRFFIEEAAGVTRYKNRKKEALRKIDATKNNLLRVTDIIHEIKRQMNGLKRQARKAERYKKHQERCKKVDVLLALHYFGNYSRQIEETDNLLARLKDTDLAQSSELKNLDAAVETIKLQSTQKNQEITDLKSHIFESQRKIDRIENDLEYMRAEAERLGSESAELGEIKTDLEAKNRSMLSEIEQVHAEQTQHQNDISTVSHALDKERTASQTIAADLDQLNQSLEDSKTRLMDLVAQEARFKNIYQNATSNRDNVKRRLKKTYEEELTAQKAVDTATGAQKIAREQLEHHRRDIATLSQRIDLLETELANRNASLASQVKRGQTLELERKECKSTFAALKKMEDNFEWFRDGVKAIMRAREARDPDNDALPFDKEAIVALLADVLEPAPSYENAVEAALGESLQYIVVKDQSAGLGSIAYLQTTGTGRSGFVPMSSLKAFLPTGNKEPDSAKLLLNHVAVRKGFEEIAQNLLGHIVVTHDIHEAQALFNRNGVYQTIVTKDGDLITPQGILIGGSKEKLSGILAKKQELRQLARRMQVLAQQIDEAYQVQQKMETDVRRAESDLQHLIEEKTGAKQQEIEAEKALYKAGEELKHAERHLEIITLEQEQLLGEASDIDDEISKFDQMLNQVSKDVTDAQNRVLRFTNEIETVSAQMEAFNQRVVDLKLKRTALNAALENCTKTLKRLKEFREDGTHRVAQLKLEIEQKTAKRNELQRKFGEYEQSLTGMYAQLEDFKTTLQTKEGEYTTISTNLADRGDQISSIQTQREETTKKIRLLELEQSQRIIKRDNVASRIEERYHRPLTAFQMEMRDALENLDKTFEELEEELEGLKKRMASIGDVNLGAISEYEQLKERHDFLVDQSADLEKAISDLHIVIRKINRITQKRFIETFDKVNAQLKEVFPRLFEGGTAKLTMTDPDNLLETGVEMMIHPPGKKLTRMSLLSGGEKALSAIAFIFAIFLIRPSSFCLMDEIDAPLDDANIFRFNNLLKMIGGQSQVVMITHNKRSMEFADTLFGITMENKGVSKIVSVNLEGREN